MNNRNTLNSYVMLICAALLFVQLIVLIFTGWATALMVVFWVTLGAFLVCAVADVGTDCVRSGIRLRRVKPAPMARDEWRRSACRG